MAYRGMGDPLTGSGETASEGNALPTSLFGTDVTVSETPIGANWLQQNKSAVYLAAGALFLMAMFGGRRR